MAAVVNLTERNTGVVRKITWAWTSHTDGKVAKTTSGAKTAKAYNGEIVRLVTIPDGTDTPTAAYDVFVYEEAGADALMGGGADRSATATEQVGPANLGVVAGDKMTLYVENAGDSKKGVVHLYIR